MIEPPLSPDEPFRLQALRKAGHLDTPIEERFERITRLAQRLLGVPIAAISLVDADRQWFKSIQGLNTTETSRAVSFCGHAILDSRVMVVPDARVDERFASNPLVTGEPRVVFYAGCPIQSEDGCNIATLCVIDHKAREMSDEDVQVLRDLASLAEAELMMSMQNSLHHYLVQQVDSMIRQVHVDPLTRLWNEDAIKELARTEFERAKVRGSCVGAIMVDVDGFRAISCEDGDAAGDDVLREVGKRLLGAIRACDAVGRLGGDEFLIVLSDCADEAEARLIAERAHVRVCEGAVLTCKGERRVSVSMGVAAWRAMSAEPGFVDAAEGALQAAKNLGKNRIEVAREQRRRKSAA